MNVVLYSPNVAKYVVAYFCFLAIFVCSIFFVKSNRIELTACYALVLIDKKLVLVYFVQT